MDRNAFDSLARTQEGRWKFENSHSEILPTPLVYRSLIYQVAQKCPTGQNAISWQPIEVFIKISGFIAE